MMTKHDLSRIEQELLEKAQSVYDSVNSATCILTLAKQDLLDIQRVCPWAFDKDGVPFTGARKPRRGR